MESYGNQAGRALQGKKSGDLNEISDHLAALTKRVDQASNRIGAALDRIHGTRPIETDAKPANAPVAANAVSELRDMLHRLSTATSWLEHSAERLDSIG